MKLTLLSFVLCSIFSTASWAANDKNDLASFHKEMGGCKSCHTQPGKVSDSETYENQQCKSCHGEYSALANPKLKLDPHASHLGDINCTSCHKGHENPNYTVMSATHLKGLRCL